MSENWRQLYSKIVDFVANHPEIKIEQSVVRIPATVNTEFYQIFNAIRKAFVEEKHEALLGTAETLSKNYIQVENELTGLPGIERISTFIPIGRFLHNPSGELERRLHDPLFDLLKGRLDMESFEKEAINYVSAYFDSLYKYGYEIWLILALIKLLQPDKSFRVIKDDFEDPDYFKHTGGLGTIATKIPDPMEIGELSFKRAPEVGYTLADQMIHSVRLGYYFSFRPEVIEALGEAINKSDKREWIPINTVVDLEPNVILVYADKAVENLALIADIKAFCRPDLIIECVGQKKSYNNEDSIARIRDYHKSYRPRLGTYIISSEPLVEQVSTELEEVGIYYLSVGFDQSRLERIVGLFADEENSGK